MDNNQSKVPAINCYSDFDPAEFIWRSYDHTDVTLGSIKHLVQIRHELNHHRVQDLTSYLYRIFFIDLLI